MTPTTEVYQTLQQAFDHFNKELFANRLPQPILTLAHNSRKKINGYYRAKAFTSRDGNITDEISLDPFAFSTKTDKELFSVLVHEMVHLWQFNLATKTSKTAHDRIWANRMELIGLMPSSTGEPGGKRTGARVTHYIIKDGAFEKAFNKLDLPVNWRGGDLTRALKKKGKPRRTKFTCPSCHANAYGKASLYIKCGYCNEDMQN